MIFYEDQRGAKPAKIGKKRRRMRECRLAKMKAPVGKEGSFKELVETWNDFKKRARKSCSRSPQGDDELARKLVWAFKKPDTRNAWR